MILNCLREEGWNLWPFTREHPPHFNSVFCFIDNSFSTDSTDLHGFLSCFKKQLLQLEQLFFCLQFFFFNRNYHEFP